MAGERIKLVVQEREKLGSAESRRLRRRGLVPGVLYGGGKNPHAIAVAERELRRVLSGPGGLHTILDVVLEGQKTSHASILKEYQRHPLRGTLTHIDLHEVRLDRPIHASVTVTLAGEPAGVKEGGVLSQVTRELNVEALPMSVPEHLEIDVGALAIGEAVRVADMLASEGVTLLDDPETVIATVTPPTRVEEPEEALEEGEEVTGVPTGEEAPEGGAESPLAPGADAPGSPG